MWKREKEGGGQDDGERRGGRNDSPVEEPVEVSAVGALTSGDRERTPPQPGSARARRQHTASEGAVELVIILVEKILEKRGKEGRAKTFGEARDKEKWG